MTLKLLILLTTSVLLAYGNDVERKGNKKAHVPLDVCYLGSNTVPLLEKLVNVLVTRPYRHLLILSIQLLCKLY